jgi:rare lipoprotein A
LFFLAVCAFHLQAQEGYKKVGYASFYHDKFEGRRTASGEKFRQKKMTCAHRTLPFGTKLLVTNLANDKTVTVTVNDRGPYAKGRIIDLTRAAAKKLDFIQSGHTRVEIEIVGDSIPPEIEVIKEYTLIEPGTTTLSGFTVQVGNFEVKDNMERMIARMKRELDKPVYVQLKGEKDNQSYYVSVGLFENRGEAFGYLDKIMPFYPGAFIVELK